MSGAREAPWWIRDPHRFEIERRRLEQCLAGLAWSFRDGEATVAGQVRSGEQHFTVEIRFSPLHPFIPPQVLSQQIRLPRHQNPVSGDLCLVDQIGNWWTPEHEAGDLIEHLKEVVYADDAGDLEGSEAPLAEPVSAYLRGSGEIVVVPEGALGQVLPQSEGTFSLARIRDGLWFLSAVDGASDFVGDRRAMGRLLGVPVGEDEVSGPWRDLGSCSGPSGTTKILDELEGLRRRLPGSRVHPQFGARQARRHHRPPLGWCAVTLLEEGPLRGQQRRAWVFRRDGLADQSTIASQALSRPAWASRIPELLGLESTSALLVGAGSIGGHAAMELARAGVGRIDIIDFDVFDLNNASRHALAPEYAGTKKATSVAARAQRSAPWSQIVGHPHFLGFGDDSEIRQLVQSASVVIDTSGTRSTTRALHHLCTRGDRATPLVSAALSAGGRGGRVIVLRDSQPCIGCFLLDERIPHPRESVADPATPPGCSHPAASCAGFDALELAAIVVRTAIRASDCCDYPALDFDWAVRNFVDPDLPWAQGRLARHPECAWCQRP